MNSYVSRKVSKLLKEKGFDVPLIYYWLDGGSGNVPTRTIDYRPENWNNHRSILRITAPTVSDVIMWFHDKHKLWIQTPYSYNDPKSFCWTIVKMGDEENDKNCWLSGMDTLNEIDGFDTPKQAYEAAFEFITNNLI